MASMNHAPPDPAENSTSSNTTLIGVSDRIQLRTILMLLALMALLSTAIGAFYYYYSLRQSAIAMAHRQAASKTGAIAGQVSAFLAENLKPVRAMAASEDIRAALLNPDRNAIARANQILDRFKWAMEADVCYLMDRNGDTIASSNRNDPDSFIGQNFSFRPYFIQAMVGMPAQYMALGMTSKKRGAYYSHPVYCPGIEKPLGVAVIKAPIRVMEKHLVRSEDGITLFTSPEGIIFSASRDDWLYKSVRKLEPEESARLLEARQFGPGPWEWVGLERIDEHVARDTDGRQYLTYSHAVQDQIGWTVIHLVDIRDVSESILAPLVKSTSWFVFLLCLFVGLMVYYLYRKARQEILRRRLAEDDLRRSEERYRHLYHNTPAMLHSIDRQGRIVSVSDYWSEALGYTDAEVTGRALTGFLTEKSRRHAEQIAMPEFFRRGYLRDVSYRFVKKNREVIDVLLSAIAERNSDGEFVRSLAVLVDITDRKKVEEDLRAAKEQLSHYSKKLEVEVRERTREITAFMEYTPAVIFMKDKDGRYLMVNSRHEQLFGTKNETLLGKTVYDVFSGEFADQFRRNDLKVLDDKQAFQMEERFPYQGGIRHYLSVRFPILDESGEVNRLCGISVDITEQKKAQEALRRLSGKILANQEKERTAIARELHDELGQVLTALRMDAVWLRRRLDRSEPEGAERAQSMCDLIDSTITEVRNIATRLRPAVLDDLGLIDALEWFTAEFEKRTGITCIFNHRRVPRVGESLAVAVYRVAQEALTNVARHAGATQTEVSLTCRDRHITLTVTDNGRGFPIEDLSEQDELGISGMRERANLLGGSFAIRSQSGRGVEVEMILPLGGTEGALH